jgi:hypothetical protein
MGDFDGTSACELINVLMKNSNDLRRVFIHTSCLKTIHPFGRDVFRGNISKVNVHRTCITFTGEKAGQIAPGKSPCH